MHHAVDAPMLKLKRQNGSFTFYTDYIANLKEPIAIAIFRLKKTQTFLGDSFAAVSMLYPFTLKQLHFANIFTNILGPALE